MDKKDQDKMLNAVSMLKQLAHPVRLSILCHLMERKTMTAGEIVERQTGRASQSQVSQYLAEFRKLGYVHAQKKGQSVLYSFASPTIQALIKLLYKEFCGKQDA